MRALLTAAALLALTATAAADALAQDRPAVAPTRPSAPAARPPVVFRGNVLIVDEAYLAVLELPPHSKATPALAEQIESRLERFLLRSGFELATVRAQAESGTIVVDIDEGRIDRVVYLGESAVGQLFFRLKDLLQENVFNRPLLQRRIAGLRKDFSLKSVRWELVALGARGEELPISALEKLRGSAVARLEEGELVRPPTGYELRVYVEHMENSSGVSPLLDIGSANGLEVGVGYSKAQVFGNADHAEFEARVAANVRQRIDNGKSEAFLSHVGGAARWFSPRLFPNDRLRAYVELGADYIERQRVDLDLNSFRFTTTDASLNLNASLPVGIAFSTGLGAEHRWLSALQPGHPGDALLPQVASTPRSQTRLFATFAAHAILPPNELRFDHKHRLDLTGTLYGLPGDAKPVQGRLTAEYQRIFYFGYHELWVQARSYFLFGQVPFPDERQVSDVVHGAFGSIYTRKVGGPRLEFRFALLRDILQFGVFDDAAFYASIDPFGNDSTPELANVIGLGLHALLLDAFQADVYFGTGLNTRGVVQSGLTLNLVQAF